MTLIHDAACLLKRGQARRVKVFPALLLGFSLAGCVSSPKATKPMSKIAKLNERAIAFHERRCLNNASVFAGKCWQVAEAGGTRCPTSEKLRFSVDSRPATAPRSREFSTGW